MQHKHGENAFTINIEERGAPSFKFTDITSDSAAESTVQAVTWSEDRNSTLGPDYMGQLSRLLTMVLQSRFPNKPDL